MEQFKRIYVPVSVNERLPVISQAYFCYWDDVGTPQGIGSREWDAEKKEWNRDEPYENAADPDYWLERRENEIVMSIEELDDFGTSMSYHGYCFARGEGDATDNFTKYLSEKGIKL